MFRVALVTVNGSILNCNSRQKCVPSSELSVCVLISASVHSVGRIACWLSVGLCLCVCVFLCRSEVYVFYFWISFSIFCLFVNIDGVLCMKLMFIRLPQLPLMVADSLLPTFLIFPVMSQFPSIRRNENQLKFISRSMLTIAPIA